MHAEHATFHKHTTPPLDCGYVHVYTGDGKGKTTAAMGLAMRAAGAGLRVFIAQFMKTGDTSEKRALADLGDAVDCRQYGSGSWVHGEPPPAEIRLAREGLAEAKRVLQAGEFDLVILDEACIAAWFHLIEVEDLLELIDAKPPQVEMVLTGRKADERLMERADLVTEMREIKHYFSQGVEARRGIEC